MPEERLQKLLAHAGIASRRKAEQFILEGRVTVNGAVVTELGTKADLEHDHIKVDGKRVQRSGKAGLSRHEQAEELRDHGERSGRPRDSDGSAAGREGARLSGRPSGLSQRRSLAAHQRRRVCASDITSAATHVAKTYVAKVNGPLTPEQEENFRQGVSLSGKRTAPAGLKLIQRAENPWYEVRLIEGRQNQIRLMFKHFGRLVEKLRRVQVGFLELGSLEARRVSAPHAGGSGALSQSCSRWRSASAMASFRTCFAGAATSPWWVFRARNSGRPMASRSTCRRKDIASFR